MFVGKTLCWGVYLDFDKDSLIINKLFTYIYHILSSSINLILTKKFLYNC